MGNSLSLKPIERYHEAEDLLASGWSERAAARELAKRWGIRNHQARRYVRLVLHRWKGEAEHATREARRAQMRENLWGLARTALGKKRQLISAKGTVYEFDDPDVRAAGSIMETLGKLDGTFDQPDQVTPGQWVDGILERIQYHYFGNVVPGNVVDGEAAKQLGSGQDGDSPQGGYARGDHEPADGRQEDPDM